MLRNTVKSAFSHLPLKNYIIFESKPCLTDNTKPVYDELLRRGYQKKYKLVWLVDEDVKKKRLLRVKGVKYIKKGDFWAFHYYLYLAKCIICCNDPIPPVNKKQVCFYISHGSPLKRVRNYYTIPANITYLISQSDVFNSEIAAQLNFPVERAVALGYPRNDVFGAVKRDVSSLFSESSKKVIAWYPTFRQHKNVRGLTDCKNAFPIIHSDTDAKELNSFAEKNNVIIVLKTHFAQDVQNVHPISLSNFKVIDDSFFTQNGISSYEFLASCDALLTDYSSVYYDFTLANKPIGLIWEDIEEFRINPGFAVDLDYYMKGAEKIYDMSQMKEFIYKVSQGIDSLNKERNEIKRIANHTIEGDATQQVTDFIIEKAEL